MKMAALSGYVSNLKYRAQAAAQRQAAINDIVSKCYALKAEDLPPIQFINIIGSDTYEHFKNSMCHTFSELARRFKLTSQSSILDIGSGCGRMAVPFSLLLDEGRYYGVDTWKEGVAWCSQYLTGKNHHMNFTTIESRNNYYYDKFRNDVDNDYHLRHVPTGSIDLTFAISCFSHLIEKDCRAYFREVARVLKPDGAAYITGFVIDKFFFEYVDRTGQHTSVKERETGCFHAYEGQDFFGGFTWWKWVQMFEDAGLRIISHDVGSWAEKPGALNYQDTFIVVKR